MVPDSVKKTMQAALNQLRTSPGFSSRKGQMTMFAEVAKTLFGVHQADGQPHRALVVEGQTGAGKTLGYLLPAIVSAIHLKKHVVVATANVALQQQIMNHDLPKLRKAGLQFEQAFVAGRGRYFCRRDAESFATNQDAPDLLSDEADNQRIKQDQSHVEQLIQLFDANQWNGLKDDFKGKINLDQPWWSQVRANRDTCSRRNCPYFNDCAFFKARQDVRDAQVIVTNHAMLYADMLHVQAEMRLLPPAKDSIFVFDEAHHIRDTFRGALATELNFEVLSKLDRHSGRLVNHVQSLINGAQLDVVNANGLAERMRDDFKSLSLATNLLLDLAHSHFNSSSQHSRGGSHQVHRFDHGVLPPGIHEAIGEQLQPALEGLNGACQRVAEKIKEAQEKAISDDSRLQNYLASLRNLHQTVQDTLNACVLLKAEINPKQGVARWLTRHSELRIDVTLSATPIQVGRQFEREIVTPAFATLFTSATLQSLGSFRRFSEQLSLYQKDGVQYLVVASPFDYQRATLVTYRDLPEPNYANEKAHTQAIRKQFSKDIGEHKAALLLFASRRQMQAFVELLPARLASDALVQYTSPRDQLIQRHKKRVDSGKRSLLIGCQSFAEGLDLPGDYLTFLGIAKLPFADIQCPIAASESEFIEAQGLHPFAVIALPDTGRRLVQAVGRLMRSQQCYGEIHIYDSRLQTKRYGQQLLRSLPPMRQQVR